MKMILTYHPFIPNITMTTAVKSISVSMEFAKLAEDFKISWSEAARVGMGMLLADKGVKDYDNNLNLYRKMRFLQTEIEKMGIKLEKNERINN